MSGFGSGSSFFRACLRLFYGTSGGTVVGGIRQMKRIKLFVRGIISRLMSDMAHLRVTIRCHRVWYGTSYGGFYVHPDVLDEASIVYSLGVGQDISFDLEIHARHGCRVYCFDPTPKSIDWIRKQDLPAGITFCAYGIAPSSGLVDFYLPRNPDFVSGSAMLQHNVDHDRKIEVQMLSLRDISQSMQHKKIDVLKMDIEGSEYDVVESVLNAGVQIGQILIEFHDRFFADGRQKSKRVVELMKNAGYEIFAVSESDEEISFIKRDVIESSR